MKKIVLEIYDQYTNCGTIEIWQAGFRGFFLLKILGKISEVVRVL